MLILTRRVGETVMIGNEVTVTVLGVKGNQVRIGVTHQRMWPFIGRRSTSASSARKKTNPAPVLVLQPPKLLMTLNQGV